MFCRNCGKELSEEVSFCPYCGTAKETNTAPVCPNCGETVEEGFIFCPKCGCDVSGKSAPETKVEYSPKSKMLAGLLGIFLGGVGVHNFYIGKTGVGVAQIIVTLVTCGAASLWGFIEGIVILCSNEPKDANGKIMKD